MIPFIFFKKHLKIILLVVLPLYGFLMHPEYVGALAVYLNPVSIIIFALLDMPFFYDRDMYQYAWFIHPILNLASNLIFWIPAAIVINRYFEKRYHK